MPNQTFRKQGWDYSSSATYMVTLNTKGFTKWFGKLDNGKVILNEAGMIAEERWKTIPDICPNVELGAFVVMPNHLHGIIHFERCNGEQWHPNEFGAQRYNLGSLIRGYKSSVTSRIWKFNPTFKWQARYDDKILLNDRAIENATRYIILNPIVAS